MSIINDALKKVAQKKVSEPVGWVSPPQPRPEAEMKARPKLNKRLAILGILCLIVPGLFLSFILIRKSSVGRKEAVLVEPEVEGSALKEVRSREAIVEEAIVPEKGPSSLLLTGIIYGFGEPCAFINNRIVEEGDIIEGAKVVKIREKEVELSFEGESLFLSIK